MKVPVRLQELLQQSEEAMKPFLMLIGQGSAEIDCTGVEGLEPEQLDLLFSYAPENWDIADLWPIIDVETLTDALASHLEQWINQRQGRTSDSEICLEESGEKGPRPTLDIFNLRDNVIRDYREYIASFLALLQKDNEERRTLPISLLLCDHPKDFMDEGDLS